MRKLKKKQNLPLTAVFKYFNASGSVFLAICLKLVYLNKITFDMLSSNMALQANLAKYMYYITEHVFI